MTWRPSSINSTRPRPPERQRRPVPWSPRAWRQALYLAAGIPAQLWWQSRSPSGPGVIRTGDSANIRCRFFWRCGDAGACCSRSLLLLPLLTRVHRHRLRVTAGIAIAPHPAGPYRWRIPARDRRRTSRSQAAWRQVCYHLLAAPALAVAAIVAIGTWLASLIYLFVYAYGWGLSAGQHAAPRPVPGPHATHLPRILGLQVDAWLTLAGVAGLFVAPWLTAGVQALDVRAARALLGPSRAEELEHRVEQLTADPGRGGGRRRRRAPPPRARPARRHPAAAGLPRHQPGDGQGPGQHRRGGARRPSPTRTRRPSPRWPSCGT